MDITKIKSALVSAALMAVLSVVIVIVQSGNIYSLDWRSLLNIGIISFLTGVVSFLKSIGTTSEGKFAGIRVKK